MSIRRRTWVTSKGVEKSAWVVDYVDAKGTRRLKSFKLKKEAEAFASKAAVEVREGVHVADRDTVTVEEAGKLWIASSRASGLERSTVEDYNRLLRLHINPFLAPVRLNALTTARLRAYEDELRENGRSASMIRRVMTALGMMLADAQERGLVVRNAARELRSRRGQGAARVERRQKGKLKVGVDIPTIEEIRALVTVLSGRWRPLFLTAIFTGLRASELRGLRWEDIDLEGGVIHVRQRADRFNDIGKPKSLSGERTVPAPPIVLNSLKEWRLICPRYEGQLALVFPNGAGKVENLRNILRRGLHPAWIAAGVTVDTGELDEDGKAMLAPKYTGMHCLRHWFASWCINRKADGGLELPPKVVQERMGHATINLTMDVYGHLFPADNDGEELASAAARVLMNAT